MKTSTATQKLPIAIALAAISASTVAISQAEAAIIIVDPTVDPLQGPGLITFDEVSISGTIGGPPPAQTAPGNNYNNVFFARDWTFNPGGDPIINPDSTIGVTFAERFVPQQLSYYPDPATGPWDAVPNSPLPTNPLALQVGNPNQNLAVWVPNITIPDNNVLSGLGVLGDQNINGVNEGAIAILFPRNQREFGFTLGGTGLGSTTLKFFRRDGSLIDTILLDSTYPFGYQDGPYAFISDTGDEIAGVSITNEDVGGIYIDDILYNNPGSPPPPQNVPEPPSVLGLLALGALGGSLKLKGKLKQ